MQNGLLKGLWRYMVPVPPALWRRKLAGASAKIKREIAFMGPEHHLVRNFTVTELPKTGKPLSSEWIASRLSLSQKRTIDILNELEAHMAFLFRNSEGEVTWAYPVTVEETPHTVTFSTGERINAA